MERLQGNERGGQQGGRPGKLGGERASRKITGIQEMERNTIKCYTNCSLTLTP